MEAQRYPHPRHDHVAADVFALSPDVKRMIKFEPPQGDATRGQLVKRAIRSTNDVELQQAFHHRQHETAEGKAVLDLLKSATS